MQDGRLLIAKHYPAVHIGERHRVWTGVNKTPVPFFALSQGLFSAFAIGNIPEYGGYRPRFTVRVANDRRA